MEPACCSHCCHTAIRQQPMPVCTGELEREGEKANSLQNPQTTSSRNEGIKKQCKMLTAHQKLTRCMEISSRESEGARDFQQADLHLEIKLKIKDKGKLKEIYDYSVSSSFPRLLTAVGKSRAGPGCAASHSSPALPVPAVTLLQSSVKQICLWWSRVMI